MNKQFIAPAEQLLERDIRSNKHHLTTTLIALFKQTAQKNIRERCIHCSRSVKVGQCVSSDTSKSATEAYIPAQYDSRQFHQELPLIMINRHTVEMKVRSNPWNLKDLEISLRRSLNSSQLPLHDNFYLNSSAFNAVNIHTYYVIIPYQAPLSQLFY